MEVAVVKADCEEREEGEIVEDDLEDVSDCSMTPGSPFDSGKSVSPAELLSGVCLSSISGSNFSKANGRRVRDKQHFHYGRVHVRRRMYRRKRKVDEHTLKRRCCHHLRRHKKAAADSNTDSENESVDPKYAKQLREALRRESSQELLHNSLKTRLKALIEPNSQSDDDLSLAMLRDLALVSAGKTAEGSNKQDANGNKAAVESGNVQSIGDSKKNEKEGGTDHCNTKPCDKGGGGESNEEIFENLEDSELRELRIAALKSCVLKNHERRKRKAAMQCQENIKTNSNKEDANDLDKENDQRMINNDVDSKITKKLKPNIEKRCENSIPKQQIDTASGNTAESNVNGNHSTDHSNSLMEEDVDVLRAVLLASMSKKLASKTVNDHTIIDKMSGLPKTLTDTHKLEKIDAVTKPNIKSLKTNNMIINNPLKRCKPNEQIHLPSSVIVKPLIINVNADSDSDVENSVNTNASSKILTSTVTEFLKKQRAEAEAAAKTKIENPDLSLSKSDDPLMEKSVMKLLPRSQQLEYRRLKQQLQNARKRTRIRRPSQRLVDNKREAIQNVKKVPKSKADSSANNSVVNGKVTRNSQEKTMAPASNLQKTLNDLQIRRNGRLQMKGKYRSLAPLLHKINHASNERQQHEREIKKLLQEIQRVQAKLAASHQLFTSLVQQLVHEKNTIDEGTKFLPAGRPFTSTPNKVVNQQQTCDISDVSLAGGSKTSVSSIKLNSNDHSVEQETERHRSTSEPNKINEVNRYNVKQQQEEVLLDPNDITKVFVEQPAIELGTVPKYTSPLGSRDGINDPQTTICPYDLLGVCKDKECQYMHCS